jgi:hypothetical protein
MNFLLLDIAAPGGSALGIGAGVAFFLVLAILAFILYWIFRKTMKLVFRVAIVGVVLFIALAGFTALWWLL